MGESTHIRFPDWAEKVIKEYQDQQKVTTKTLAILHLLRYGHAHYCLITNQKEVTVDDFAMRTLADSLTEQQKDYLLKIIISEMGAGKLERLRERATGK